MQPWHRPVLSIVAALLGAFVGVLLVSVVVGPDASDTWSLAGAVVGALTLSYPFRQARRP